MGSGGAAPGEGRVVSASERTMASAVHRYWFPALPAARLAVFSRIIHLTVLLTVFRFDRWVADHAFAPRPFWQPVAVARWVGLPAPTPGTMALLQWVIGVATFVAIIGVGPTVWRRLVNLVVATSYLTWIVWAFSFSKVDHDRLTIIVALFVLVVVPGTVAGRDAADTDALAGWGLRTVQIAFVLAYPLSAFTKLRKSGIGWISSAVFARAIVRRGSEFGDWFADRPSLLRAGQAAFITFEFLAVFALRRTGRLRVIVLVGVVLLHLFTYAAVGIHFLPHTICITAFLPLERLHPRWRATRHVGDDAAPDDRELVGA